MGTRLKRKLLENIYLARTLLVVMNEKRKNGMQWFGHVVPVSRLTQQATTIMNFIKQSKKRLEGEGA